MTNKKFLFISNFIFFGLFSSINKFIPFILLPIITRLVSDPAEFGVYSMFTSLVGFGIPLAVLGTYDSVFREFFDTENFKKKLNITTTSHRIVLFSSTIIMLFFLIFSNQISIFLLNTSDYNLIVLYAGISIFISANKSAISAPTKLLNKKTIYVSSNILSTITYYSLAIFFLQLNLGFISLVYSNLISTFFLLVFFWVSNRKFFLEGSFSVEICKRLLRVGLPLMPTFLIYWVFNSVDKIMIANILNLNEVGVYSIGSKIGSISLIVYSAFSGGFSFFKFSTMKDKNQVSFNSKLFEYIFALSIISLIFITPISPFLFDILFDDSYSRGYVVTPYLFAAPLLLMCFQIIASQFIIINKSYMVTLFLLIGAISNVLLNFLTIPLYGIEGAAVSTLLGYLISLGIAMLFTFNYKLLTLNLRVVTLIFILIFTIFQLMYISENSFLFFSLPIVFITTIFLLYFKNIISFISSLMIKFKNAT